MHILFLTHYFVPENNAPAARVHAMAREWARVGHRVTVLTCAPNVPAGVVYEGYENRLYQEEWVDGIRTARVWTYLAANRGRVRRGLNYLSYLAAAGAAGPLIRPKADVVIATSPQFFAGWAGWPVARAHGAPFVLEIRDIWPDSIVAVGALKEGRIVHALERLEKALYDGADHIVAVGEGYRQNILRKGVAPEKVSVVTNGVDADLFTPRPPDPELRAPSGLRAGDVRDHVRRHHRHGERAGGGAGRGGAPQGAGARTTSPSCSSATAPCARSWSSGRAPRAWTTSSSPAWCRAPTCPRYLASSDACLVHFRKQELFSTILPSKFFEDAAMEKPILLGFEGEARALLDEAGCGVAFEPSNDAELAEAAVRLADDRAACARMGEAGRRYVLEHFDRRLLAHDYLEILERVRAARRH